jgi:hypothetical protein
VASDSIGGAAGEEQDPGDGQCEQDTNVPRAPNREDHTTARTGSTVFVAGFQEIDRKSLTTGNMQNHEGCSGAE